MRLVAALQGQDREAQVAPVWGVPDTVQRMDRQDLHLYRCLPHIKGGANTIITCLWRSICTLIEAGWFPKDGRLYLQVDGASENANQQMPRFASWLCQQKICRTVRGASVSWAPHMKAILDEPWASTFSGDVHARW